MKILLIEDHAIVRYGIVRILSGISVNISVDECDDFNKALKRFENNHYNLVILDINIPNGSNFQMIPLIRLRQRDIKILVFSGSDERIFALRYLKEGADGYLMKDSPNQDIIDAVTCVMNNEKYVSINIRQQLLQSIRPVQQGRSSFLTSLSDREVEVMQCLIQGNSIGEIARSMNLHISTVSTYKARIFQKLDVKNIIELAEKQRMAV